MAKFSRKCALIYAARLACTSSK